MYNIVSLVPYNYVGVHNLILVLMEIHINSWQKYDLVSLESWDHLIIDSWVHGYPLLQCLYATSATFFWSSAVTRIFRSHDAYKERSSQTATTRQATNSKLPLSADSRQLPTGKQTVQACASSTTPATWSGGLITGTQIKNSTRSFSQQTGRCPNSSPKEWKS